MDKPIKKTDIERSCKARADQLQADALARGEKLKRGPALEAAAKELGYRDWNAAAAASKIVPMGFTQDPKTWPLVAWTDLEEPLPEWPLRIRKAGSTFYRSIQELVRWSRALERIAATVAQEDRSGTLQLFGGEIPYVFVRDEAKWGDDLYRLCDRGYEPWPGIVFTREEMQLAGVDTWQAQYGGHSGTDMLTVGGDGLIDGSDETILRGLARLLASTAVVADRAFVRQDGQTMPEGIGFTIDLTDSGQLTSQAVARMLACRDDSVHRQLRVTSAGTAFISSNVGNNRLKDLAFRLETWDPGNSYVGLRAAADAGWVATVLRQLKDNWPEPKSNYIDH